MKAPADPRKKADPKWRRIAGWILANNKYLALTKAGFLRFAVLTNRYPFTIIACRTLEEARRVKNGQVIIDLEKRKAIS